MRRLPVYLLIDTSELMVGSAIESVRDGLSAMLVALRKNPYALEMGALSVISFGGKAQCVTPLTEIYAFQQPELEIKPGTSLGAAIDILDRAITTEIVKTTPEQKGDYKPLVFVLTDGQPTDQWRPVVQRFRRNHKSVIVYAIGCGDDVDFSILKELTENTYSMEQMDADAFAKLFVCISSSISSASGAIGEQGVQASAINLEKDAGGAVKKVEGETLPRPQKGDRFLFRASVKSLKSLICYDTGWMFRRKSMSVSQVTNWTSHSRKRKSVPSRRFQRMNFRGLSRVRTVEAKGTDIVTVAQLPVLI